MRILVAGDDAALASFIKKGLASEHYAVDVSSDGEQARAMAGESSRMVGTRGLDASAGETQVGPAGAA
jgi:DNA-binding response OmpR family regulator